MKQITPKQSFYIRIFILVMIILLCTMIFLKQTDNVCENCVVQFSYTPLYSSEVVVKDVKMIEIYEEYVKERCKVIKTNDGFIVNG